MTVILANEVDKADWRSSTETRCGVHRGISFRSWMKDEKRKRLKVEQMEDSMGNGVNVMIGRGEVETGIRQRRGEAASNKGRKQGSKQSESMNEAHREDEERLQSVAFGAWPQ